MENLHIGELPTQIKITGFLYLKLLADINRILTSLPPPCKPQPQTLMSTILGRLFLNLCLLCPLIFAITVCVCSSEILKVNQYSRVIDYMSVLCHMQLTQIDCTLHYSVSAWKINKYGENPPQLSTSHRILVGLRRIMLL
jgi:hypothetical protein